MVVADQVALRIQASAELIRWLDDQIGEFEAPGGLRLTLALSANDLVRQHHRAIVHLCGLRLIGSAAALLRACFESYVRGVWLLRCATDEQIELFVRDKFEIKFGQAIKDIESLSDFDSGVLSEAKKSLWRLFSSFAHSGIDAVGRQVKGTTIEPNFHDAEIIQFLGNADAFAKLAAFQLAEVKGSEDLKRALLERT